MTSDAGKAYKLQPLIAINTMLDILAVFHSHFTYFTKAKKKKAKGLPCLSEKHIHALQPLDPLPIMHSVQVRNLSLALFLSPFLSVSLARSA